MCAKRKAAVRYDKKTTVLPRAKSLDEQYPVLYIHPAKQGVTFDASEKNGRPYGVIPVGLPALVNVLRENQIRVKGIVHPLEMQLDPGFSLRNWLKKHFSAKVILIDLHWYEHCYGAVDTARFCKEVLPGAWVILGGLSATGFFQEILAEFPAVDFIVRGDAEKPLLELVQTLLGTENKGEAFEKATRISNIAYRGPDGVVDNPELYIAATPDLDCLNFVDLDFLEHSREYFVHEYIVTDLVTARKMLNEETPNLGRWITTARGCRYNCSYCGGSKAAHKMLSGRIGVIPRSVERVVDDLENLSKQGIIQASMAYDIAEMGEEYWRPLFDGMKKREIRIGIYNEFFQMPEMAFIDEMARTVVREHSPVAISPLSGNERVRRLNGKHYSNEQFFELLERLNRHKIFIFVYFSLNLPGESRKTFEETLELARSVYEFYPSSLLKILNTVHTIDPLSPMNLAPEKYGVSSNMHTFKDYYNYCYNTRFADPEARVGQFRGFDFSEEGERSLVEMANAWDNARVGREKSWWPIPHSW
jgi:radical SAM superfamily enzyme YgiQ (UPF0313 family)